MSYSRCECCGNLFGWKDWGQSPPAVCVMCEVRGGVCLHNVSEHPGKAHSSRVGPHNRGDPVHCGPCIESRAAARWARERGLCIDWTQDGER